MATSSITHNFVLSNPQSAERFVAALDASNTDPRPNHPIPGRHLSDPSEILALMKKRKKNV